MDIHDQLDQLLRSRPSRNKIISKANEWKYRLSTEQKYELSCLVMQKQAKVLQRINDLEENAALHAEICKIQKNLLDTQKALELLEQSQIAVSDHNLRSHIHWLQKKLVGS